MPEQGEQVRDVGDVVTTPAFDALVEAGWRARGASNCSHSTVRRILVFALAACSQEDCTTCSGTEQCESHFTSTRRCIRRAGHDGNHFSECPDCVNGKRPGHSLLVAALVEAGILDQFTLSGGNYPDEGGPVCLREVPQGDQHQ